MLQSFWKHVQRNSLIYHEYCLNPVEDFSIFSGFNCISPTDTDRDLEAFLCDDAERHFKDRIAVTYSLAKKGFPLVPLGFATLQNDAITISKDALELPEVLEYHYKAFPAVKIGRFGIILGMQNNGLGSVFLFMLKKLMLEANRTGCRFITVDARRDKKNKVDTTNFYEKNGFALLPCREKTSRYIPMYFDLMQFT
jgi:hypothetical protein